LGTVGYRYADEVTYQPDEIILEVGSGSSTRFLAGLGPPVVTVDVDLQAFSQVVALPNVEAHHGRAENVLRGWNRPIGFAWLDGWDWPYAGNPPGYYADQQAAYESREQEYSQEISLRSHLAVVQLIADHARVVAFDDTWRTHAYVPVDRYHARDACAELVPPATTPAPRLAMDQPTYRPFCGLEADHPHHDDPDRGWNGKGGTAVPYLLERGFDVVDYGLGLVVLERSGD
jgi:hypothetical protein